MDSKAVKSSPFSSIPDELIGEIGATIGPLEDFFNFRVLNKRVRDATKYALGKRMDNLTVYPRYASMKSLLVALEDEDVAKYVRSLTLMAEGLKQHEYGYAWAWEDLQIWAEFKFTNEDADIMRTIDAAHSFDVVENGDFIISGQYREMLTILLQRLPNITALTIRKLAPGEHIPGWAGVDLFKQLSFYHEGLDTRHIFYGDWQYDTLHRCITHYLDDFGDHITEPHAGPQASFIDDLKAAVDANKIKANVTFLPAN